MRTYFVRVIVLLKNGVETSLQYHGVISTQKVDLLHYERHWFVLIASFREIDGSSMFLEFNLYDLRMDDTWLGARVVNPLLHEYYEFVPYEQYPGKQYAPDEVIIVVHIDPDMGLPSSTTSSVN